MSSMSDILHQLCVDWGHDRVMSIVGDLWATSCGGDRMNRVIGPCEMFTVPCTKCGDDPVSCDWCNGSEWLTRHVANISKLKLVDYQILERVAEALLIDGFSSDESIEDLAKRGIVKERNECATRAHAEIVDRLTEIGSVPHDETLKVADDVAYAVGNRLDVHRRKFEVGDTVVHTSHAGGRWVALEIVLIENGTIRFHDGTYTTIRRDMSWLRPIRYLDEE